MYPGQIRPTKNQILNHVRGDDGGKSLRGWFHENTAGNYVPDSVTLIGCDDGAWFVAPPERRGDWYWNNGLYLMWQDAIKAGDPFIDFHAYDRDGDNHVSPQEVGVFILRPQNGPYGTFQPGTGFTVDGIAAPLSIAFLDLYFSAIESHRTWNVGLMAHEASHGLLGPMDMYTYGAYVSDPGYYSIMSSHALATHLDPFLKLKDGHLTPDLVEINGWETKTVKLKAVETSQEAVIIYDPAKKDREYFIVENRWSGAAAAANYDAGLPAKGIVVWHIVEDLALANMYRPLGTPSFVVEPWEWERLGVRLIGVLSRAGNSTTLKWADGSSSNIRITAMSVPNSEIYVEIAKLP
jgi:M6 family metalloprotease-like protein